LSASIFALVPWLQGLGFSTAPSIYCAHGIKSNLQYQLSHPKLCLPSCPMNSTKPVTSPISLTSNYLHIQHVWFILGSNFLEWTWLKT
jgi:hypothetical protein